MAANKKKIDINKATCEDFESLIGIGHAKAEAIIEARQGQGGFDSLNALLEIPGIGHVFLEHNKGKISCGKFTPARTPATRKSDRDNKSKNKLMEKSSTVTTSMITPVSSEHGHTSSATNETRTSRTCTPCTSKTPCSRSRSALKTDTSRRKLTRHTSKSPRRILTTDDGDSSEGDGALTDKTSGQSESEDTVTENSSGQSESDGAQTVKSVHSSHSDSVSRGGGSASSTECAGSAVSVLSSAESQADNVMECTGNDCPSSPDHELMSDSPSSPAFSEKPWMKRKSDGEGTIETTCGKKPRSLRVKSCTDSDYLGHDSAASLRSCLAAACNTGTITKQRIPSKSNPPPQLAEWLKIYQEWGHAERLLALDELVELCEPTQVRHLMAVIEPQFQRDFISLLPKELALYVLSFLDPKDLLQAAQTCRYWRVLAEDNLLWREKCREESIDEATVFENRVRRHSEANGTVNAKSPWKNLYLRQKSIEHNWGASPIRPPKVLKGHDDHVITCLEFSGTKVVSGSDDNTLKVWSAVTGKCLRTLVGHTGGVWSSQMCGNVVISGSTDRTLKVWNAESGQCTHTLYGHTSTVRCMHLNGEKVVSGSRDATLRLWNVESGQCLHVLMGHMAAVRCVQYDGKRVVSGAYDYTVRVWDPETENCVHVLSGHTNRVYSLQFDGIHIVSGSLDTSIRVWDVESGNCLHTLIGHQSLTSGMELKDNLLVSGNADSTVKVWDITTGQCLQTLQGSNKHQSAVTCLQFNKKFVITSSDDGSVKIWDLRAGEFLRNLVALDSGGSGGVVWRIRCSNTKLICAVGSRNGTEETKLLVIDFDVEEGEAKTDNNSTNAVIMAT